MSQWARARQTAQLKNGVFCQIGHRKLCSYFVAIVVVAVVYFCWWSRCHFINDVTRTRALFSIKIYLGEKYINSACNKRTISTYLGWLFERLPIGCHQPTPSPCTLSLYSALTLNSIQGGCMGPNWCTLTAPGRDGIVESQQQRSYWQQNNSNTKHPCAMYVWCTSDELNMEMFQLKISRSRSTYNCNCYYNDNLCEKRTERGRRRRRRRFPTFAVVDVCRHHVRFHYVRFVCSGPSAWMALPCCAITPTRRETGAVRFIFVVHCVCASGILMAVP